MTKNQENAHKFNRPEPCSKIFGPSNREAPSIIACFMLAGLMIFQRMDSGITLASKQMAPATTGLATLVPERLLQPEFILDPMMSLP